MHDDNIVATIDAEFKSSDQSLDVDMGIIYGSEVYADKVIYDGLISDVDNVEDALDKLETDKAPAYVEIPGKLPAGQTTVTFSDASISDDSTFDVYVDDAFIGVVPTALTVSTVGTPSVTLTFDEQSSDMPVKVRIS